MGCIVEAEFIEIPPTTCTSDTYRISLHATALYKPLANTAVLIGIVIPYQEQSLAWTLPLVDYHWHTMLIVAL